MLRSMFLPSKRGWTDDPPPLVDCCVLGLATPSLPRFLRRLPGHDYALLCRPARSSTPDAVTESVSRTNRLHLLLSRGRTRGRGAARRSAARPMIRRAKDGRSVVAVPAGVISSFGFDAPYEIEALAIVAWFVRRRRHRRLRLCRRVVARWEGIGPSFFIDENNAGPVSIDENADGRFRSPISDADFRRIGRPTAAADGSAWRWTEDSRVTGGKDDES